MKTHVYASTTDSSSAEKKISSAIFDFIRFELGDQVGYYKQLRRQFTVNGKKYVVKNDAKGQLNVVDANGKNLYKHKIPDAMYGYVADDAAAAIINDAYYTKSSVEVGMGPEFTYRGN